MKITDTNNIQISRNFNLREFQDPVTREVKIYDSLVARLQQVRYAVGKPIVITSGYRTEKHNKFVGGLKLSQHRIGAAVDISIIGHNSAKLKKLLKIAGFKQLIVYKKKKIIHVALFKKNPFLK